MAFLKQRVVLSLIFSAAFRGQKVIKLRISAIDFEHKLIHIPQSRYKKGLIVPLAESMAAGLKKYLEAENRHIWLFNGKEPYGHYCVSWLSWVMRENLNGSKLSLNYSKLAFSEISVFL